MGVENPLSLAKAQALFAAIAGVVGDFSARIFKNNNPGFYTRDLQDMDLDPASTGDLRMGNVSDFPHMFAENTNKFVTLTRGLFLPLQNPVFECTYIVDRTGTSSYLFGFGDKDFNDVIAFYWDTGVGHSNWHVTWNAFADDVELSAANSTDGNNHVPNTAALEKLRIEVTSATSIKFYIDDVLVYTATTNINTDSIPVFLGNLNYSIGRLRTTVTETEGSQDPF